MNKVFIAENNRVLSKRSNQYEYSMCFRGEIKQTNFCFSVANIFFFLTMEGVSVRICRHYKKELDNSRVSKFLPLKVAPMKTKATTLNIQLQK